MEITIQAVKEFLSLRQGQEITLAQIRDGLFIEKYGADGFLTKSWKAIPKIMLQLEEQGVVVTLKRGDYKIVKQVFPVEVLLDNPSPPPFPLCFPRDFNTGQEMPFAEDIIVRQGDIILIAGMSNYFKTGLCLNFLGENIDSHPVIMGNEYTIIAEQTPEHPNPYDISPRFLNRLKTMSSTNTETGGMINWRDANGRVKFTLLPVWGDYAQHIIKDRINIIDWINLPGEYYMISDVMEKVKKALGKGIGILVIQKNEGSDYGMGGGRTEEFADVVIKLDSLGKTEVLITMGKVKESLKPLKGLTYAFMPSKGVNILNLREVKPCPSCKGTGYVKAVKCEMCWGLKVVDGEA